MNTLFQYLEIAVAKEFTGTERVIACCFWLAFQNGYSLSSCFSHSLRSVFLRTPEKLILSRLRIQFPE